MFHVITDLPVVVPLPIKITVFRLKKTGYDSYDIIGLSFLLHHALLMHVTVKQVTKTWLPRERLSYFSF